MKSLDSENKRKHEKGEIKFLSTAVEMQDEYKIKIFKDEHRTEIRIGKK